MYASMYNRKLGLHRGKHAILGFVLERFLDVLQTELGLNLL